MSKITKLETERLVEELIITDELIHQVFAVGLVDNPAIEVNWMKFSQEQKFAVDKAKRILTGPLAIPNLEIYRTVEGNPDGKWVFFSESTIEKLSQNFLKFGHQNTSTHNHLFNLPGNTVIESWLISDETNDKALALGYKNLPKGTWMISVKVGDESYWNDYIESGILKGFSLEGMFDDKVVQQRIEQMGETKKPRKKRKNKWKLSMRKLLEYLKSLNFSADATVSEITEEMEAAMFLLEFKEGDRIIEVDTMWQATYSDDMTFLPEGEYAVKTSDMTANYIIVIGAEGKVLEMITPWGIEMQGTETETVVDTTVQTEEVVTETHSAEVESLKIENKNLEVKIAELTAKINQMSKQKDKTIEVKSSVDKSTKTTEQFSSNDLLNSIKKNKK